jgi:hypothetical protein
MVILSLNINKCVMGDYGSSIRRNDDYYIKSLKLKKESTVKDLGEYLI